MERFSTNYLLLNLHINHMKRLLQFSFSSDFVDTYLLYSYIFNDSIDISTDWKQYINMLYQDHYALAILLNPSLEPYDNSIYESFFHMFRDGDFIRFLRDFIA